MTGNLLAGPPAEGRRLNFILGKSKLMDWLALALEPIAGFGVA